MSTGIHVLHTIAKGEGRPFMKKGRTSIPKYQSGLKCPSCTGQILGSTLTSPLGPCYCPAPGRTTFSAPPPAFDFLANNANWQAIVFEIGSPGKGKEKKTS